MEQDFVSIVLLWMEGWMDPFVGIFLDLPKTETFI